MASLNLSAPSPTRLYVLFLLFRIVNSLSIRTFFQPDEYFQALEPAWQMAFGPASGAWITWEWNYQLRSSLHPLIFSVVYILADKLSCLAPFLRPHALLLAPCIAQAALAAAGDLFTYRLATRVYGSNSPIASATIILTLVNPWLWFCSVRTFSNSLETSLTAAALAFWPWCLVTAPAIPEKENPKGRPSDRPSSSGLATPELAISLALAALAVVLRPTNLLIWLPVAALTIIAQFAPELQRQRQRLRQRQSQGQIIGVLVGYSFLCGSLVLAVSAVADRLFFAHWTFPPYNWLYFNLSQSLAVFYGRNIWHFYFLQAIPLLSMASLPFVIAGIVSIFRSSSTITTATTTSSSSSFESTSTVTTTTTTAVAATTKSDVNSNSLVACGGPLRAMCGAAFVNLLVLSLITHKEVRFINPLLPILTIVAAPSALSFFTTIHEQSHSKPTSNPKPDGIRMRNTSILTLLLLINIVVGGYLSLFHQAAPIQAVAFLRSEFTQLHPDLVTLSPSSPEAHPHTTPHLGQTPADGDHPTDSPLFALFLTPCHTTPWRSHLLYPRLTARALTCEPPLHTAPDSEARATYRDETDRFHDNPVPFLLQHIFRPASVAQPAPSTWSKRVANPKKLATATSSAYVVLPRYIVGFEGIEPWLTEAFGILSDTQGPAAVAWGDKTEAHTLHYSFTRVWAGWNGFFNDNSQRGGRLVVWQTHTGRGP